MLKALMGRAARRLAPRTLARLDTIDRLGEDIAALEVRCAGLQGTLQQAHDRCARLEERVGWVEDHVRGAGDGIAELHGRLSDVDALRDRLEELESDLAEGRRLGLRVAQLTDLVFDRLATAPGRPQT